MSKENSNVRDPNIVKPLNSIYIALKSAYFHERQT